LFEKKITDKTKNSLAPRETAWIKTDKQKDVTLYVELNNIKALKRYYLRIKLLK